MNKHLKILITLELLFLFLLLIFLSILPKNLFNKPTSFVIEASNQNLLSASIASDGQWRFPPITEVPLKFEQCIIAYEDKRFYQHMGVDPIALFRAIKQNFTQKKIVSGASTLSMQVIRLSTNEKRTIYQKIKELFLAYRLELKYSKEEILSLYASNAPFGTNVVGLEAAGWRYFGRPLNTLSWGEMATLAVLPNNPSMVHPGKNRSTLIKKRNNLLDKLIELNYIDRSTAKMSKLEPVPNNPLPLPQHALHLLNRFKSEKKLLNVRSSRLTTTLDENLQLKITDILEQYQNKYIANDINNIAALVLNIEKNEVVSYVGNIYKPHHPDFESHVDMIKARRSPGSTLKPLLYASMLTEGLILPRTLIADVPTQISGYAPQNFNLGYDGAVPADKALSRSLNIPAVKMLQQYKYPRFYNQLKKLGFSTLNKPADHYGLSLILGGNEVTMWDLANVYSGMARTLNHSNTYKGLYNTNDYLPANYIKNYNNQLDPILERNSIVDHGSIWTTFNAMEEVMRPGEEGLWEQFSSSQRIAWKTGTSFGFRDGWAIGINTQYVVFVWVGNADGEGRPGLIGIETAAPVLFDIFKTLPLKPWFNPPKTKLKIIKTCNKSGYKAGENCDDFSNLFVSPAAEKSPICPYHKKINVDLTQNFMVNDNCESVSKMKQINWFVLPPSMEYYYKIKNPDYKPLPSYKAGCEIQFGNNMDIIYPKNGTSIYIPLELSGERGKLIIQATHRNPETKIFWHIDNKYISTTTHQHQLEIETNMGWHQITLTDEHGETMNYSFNVLSKSQS